jgi:serine/threonine protein kinase
MGVSSTLVTVPPRLQRGEAVGRYVVLHLVGRGAMGEVYKAHDTALDRAVALKVLTVAPADQQLEESIAVREGQMLALVRHPGVVAVYDVGVHPPSTFIALEFVEGRSLREAIAEGKLDAPTMRDIGRQLAEGLVAVHEAGLIHRDIKPANILLDTAGSARLADLGVAKLVNVMTPDEEGTSATWVGTPGYRAPEVEAGAQATATADVYSLCAALCKAAPASPSRAWRALLRVLRRGTDPDPTQRPSARELAASLRP